MAELADALDSGSSGLTALEVRVLFRAPNFSKGLSRFETALRVCAFPLSARYLGAACGIGLLRIEVRCIGDGEGPRQVRRSGPSGGSY
jgi:hypothetical protein